ncbi:DUF1707 SHOCT-like domain-containing protein [Solicola sp. PLA-1-18]|uniref:DUF1707 SHOCT-like domain-containing protein n=1 Tax=Solicola sp. PLA-1-18 TaxID=3380532 RepID=UPI003B7AC765
MSSDHDPRRGLRASDADREAVVEILRDAAGEGRLSFEEMDERQDAAYAARTYAELEPLVADLPDAELPWADAPRAMVPLAPRDEPLVLTAGGTNQARRGRWAVPARVVLNPQVSSIVLDFRHATCPHRVVAVEVHGGVGNVTLVVPDGWGVDTDQLRSSWGTVRNKRQQTAERSSPTLVVSGGIGMGTFRARGALFYERLGDSGEV